MRHELNSSRGCDQIGLSGISVGPAQSLWIEGKSMVIDDTYPHSATCVCNA